MSWTWLLYSVVYGLADAPRFWLRELEKEMVRIGSCQSVMDETCLYLRRQPDGPWGRRTGKLNAMITVQVDGLGVTGTPEAGDWVFNQL